jgi:hypothetical protein
MILAATSPTVIGSEARASALNPPSQTFGSATGMTGTQTRGGRCRGITYRCHGDIEQCRTECRLCALLGMLALAGYQNRDKLSELLKGATSSRHAIGHRAGVPPRRPSRKCRRNARSRWRRWVSQWRSRGTARKIQAERTCRCGSILDKCGSKQGSFASRA